MRALLGVGVAIAHSSHHGFIVSALGNFIRHSVALCICVFYWIGVNVACSISNVDSNAVRDPLAQCYF